MLLFTRHDVHEDCGYFVEEQHDGMVGDGQQQEEKNGGSARHQEGYPRSKNVPKPRE